MILRTHITALALCLCAWTQQASASEFTAEHVQKLRTFDEQFLQHSPHCTASKYALSEALQKRGKFFLEAPEAIFLKGIASINALLFEERPINELIAAVYALIPRNKAVADQRLDAFYGAKSDADLRAAVDRLSQGCDEQIDALIARSQWALSQGLDPKTLKAPRH